MSKQARTYIYGVVGTGMLVLAAAFSNWTCPDPLRFSVYLLLGLVASMLKVRLPGITGTFSLNFLFLLIGVTNFGLAETVAMGAAAALVQCFWHASERPKVIQVLFNVGNLSISIAAAFLVSHAAPIETLHHLGITMLVAISVYFVINTGLVAGVLALIEAKPFVQVWQHCFLLSFLYYLAGAGIAALMNVWTREVDWKSSLLVLPLLYLVYFYYRLYVTAQPVAGLFKAPRQ